MSAFPLPCLSLLPSAHPDPLEPNSTTVAYDQLVADFVKRVAQEAPGLTFPDKFFLLDLSLENAFDKSVTIETSFWSNPANAHLGAYLNWPIGFAGILPPTLYARDQIAAMSAFNGSVWGTDQLPARIEAFRQMLFTPHASGLPLVLLVHCSAGCDRTGQFVGSYRMQYQNSNVTGMYALDTTECGRSPNFFATSGLEWFCYYLQLHTAINPGDCVGFADCKFWGNCHPK